MMPPENIPATPPADVGPNPDGAPKPAPLPPPDQQPLRCPRCDSPNTKFCYYNNYSLSQPRHFCKTCRRYWTKGGALRNVPIGGGCRKSKKSKSSASSRISTETKDPTFASDTSPSLNFLHGLSPTAQFHLNGLHFSRLHSHSTTPLNQFFSFADLSSSSPSSTIPLPNSAPPLDSATNSIQTPLMDFNYPLPSIQRQELRPRNLVQTSIASSIESLSSINQDLHWKLQQQRLGMIYGGENQKEQPISYHAAESSKAEAFLGSSSGGGGGNNTSSWNEIQTWNDFHQYSALP